MMICSTENITTFLTSSPRALDEAQMTDIAEALSVSLQAAGARLPPPVATYAGDAPLAVRDPSAGHADPSGCHEPRCPGRCASSP